MLISGLRVRGMPARQMRTRRRERSKKTTSAIFYEPRATRCETPSETTNLRARGPKRRCNRNQKPKPPLPPPRRGARRGPRRPVQRRPTPEASAGLHGMLARQIARRCACALRRAANGGAFRSELTSRVPTHEAPDSELLSPRTSCRAPATPQIDRRPPAEASGADRSALLKGCAPLTRARRAAGAERALGAAASAGVWDLQRMEVNASSGRGRAIIALTFRTGLSACEGEGAALSRTPTDRVGTATSRLDAATS